MQLARETRVWGIEFSGPSKLVIFSYPWTKIQPLLKTDLSHHTMYRHPFMRAELMGFKFNSWLHYWATFIFCGETFCADSMTRLNWKSFIFMWEKSQLLTTHYTPIGVSCEHPLDPMLCKNCSCILFGNWVLTFELLAWVKS